MQKSIVASPNNFQTEDTKDFYNKQTSIIKSSNLSTPDLQSYSDSLQWTMDTTKNTEVLEIPQNIPAFDKEKSHQYSLISYLTSKKKPDVYMGEMVLKARNYKISTNNTQKHQSEQKLRYKLSKDGPLPDSSFEDSSSSESSIDNYEKMKKKDLRYYAIGNITIKCYNCNEVGHVSKNCPYDLVITCLKCNGKGHEDFECPNIKCFKCNRIGHKSFECKVSSKDIVKCENCKNVGHEKEDCLINPTSNKSDRKAYKCYFCNKEGHFICSIGNDYHIIEDYHSDNVIMSESECEESEKYKSDDSFSKILNKKSGESIISNDKLVPEENGCPIPSNETLQKKKRKRIFNAFRNEEIRRTIFCPKCGGQHSHSTCTVQLRYNSFDQLRKNYSKFLFQGEDRYDRTYRKDDKEHKHIKEKKNKYHDVDFSSDESFEQTLNRNKKKNLKKSFSDEKKFSDDYSSKSDGESNSDSDGGINRRDNKNNNNKDNFKYSKHSDNRDKHKYNEPYSINKNKDTSYSNRDKYNKSYKRDDYNNNYSHNNNKNKIHEGNPIFNKFVRN